MVRRAQQSCSQPRDASTYRTHGLAGASRYPAVGGSARVDRARDRLSGEVITLKRLPLGVRSGVPSDALADLGREFELLATSHDPNVVDVPDYGFDEASQSLSHDELRGGRIEHPRV